MDKFDRMRIMLYGNGRFIGYLKSVSQTKGRVLSTQYKEDAKSYAKKTTADKDVEIVKMLTHGAIEAEID